ncbi:MAG: endolytic transglycosylase MltG [Chloroflexi bacterium]|nr:endolytic transglycosylase MltG [Chloroflexota bacterium]
MWVSLVLLVMTVFVLLFARRALTPLNTGKKIDFEVRKGETFSEAGNRLQKEGIIRSALGLKILIKTAGRDRDLKQGIYEVSSNMRPAEIIKMLINGEVKSVWVTFPEGITAEEMGGILEKKKIISQKDFVFEAKNYETVIEGEHFKGLEGLLYPDTYNVATNITPSEMAELMLEQFKSKAVPLYRVRKQRYKLSLRDSVTLASLIEREASQPGELPVMAGVYMNRLKTRMLLNCDATIQYALGGRKTELTYKDLEIDSPYNTYKHPGLPPGPIGNPGLEALKAAFRPAGVPYYYYVLNWKANDGSHIFTTTYQEHLKAIREADQ